MMFELSAVKFKDILLIDYLTIEAQSITAVVGSSGGGKTTFLKLFNNMNSADQGDVFYKNRKINYYDPVKLRREVTMLPQNPVVFPGSLADNFSLIEKLTDHKLSSFTKYKKLLSKVDLNYKLDRAAADLSGGEKQRLALARVMLLDPEVLLLDEPSSALDSLTEQKIIEVVVNYVKNKAKTLLMVTHSTRLANDYADQIITIEDGKIKENK
ncbi:ABC transporter ATP-binding protein [Halanaerobium salsuginis]|uniref:Putative ABC transport system ATP-binding protein n=1 Tax=Halanaerobium salsuginis TaxID=29563 RepID=A0A1I4KSF2_9FIRM|nr:ATP-binding cassette domain-containing protein [Halanaerobium salsuginis]SFL81543.1 putative ABC transport system ATP-binding protein [Halanaerobium salsuginis]